MADVDPIALWVTDPTCYSLQRTERIVHLYLDLGFQVRQLDGPRRISRTGDRTPAKEVLATRNV